MSTIVTNDAYKIFDSKHVVRANIAYKPGQPQTQSLKPSVVRFHFTLQLLSTFSKKLPPAFY